jgi:hypothetical protein
MTQPVEVPSTRYVLDHAAIGRELGPLGELSGTWEGRGFNLIARPDFRDKADLYLQLNQTHETLTVTPIGSAIPNRGFGQDDIELFGLSYLQKVHDHHTGGALHLEPGLWITQPPTTYPPENPPLNGRIIARMASIPHGNAVLAQGSATSFTGAPTLSPQAGTEFQAGSQIYNGSVFRSFNSTPFAAAPPVINAHGSSERETAAQISALPFEEYDVSIPGSAANPRTPFATNPPEPQLPETINGVPMQAVINDPIRLLQAVIEDQQRCGHAFEGSALNITTQATVTFRLLPNSPRTNPTVNIRVPGAAGGIANIPFLEGGEPTGALGPNAQTGLVYATFWIEKVMPKSGNHFMQLQYAQMTVLNFPVFTLLHPPQGGPPAELVNVGWPHISVATLRKAF